MNVHTEYTCAMKRCARNNGVTVALNLEKHAAFGFFCRFHLCSFSCNFLSLHFKWLRTGKREQNKEFVRDKVARWTLNLYLEEKNMFFGSLFASIHYGKDHSRDTERTKELTMSPQFVHTFANINCSKANNQIKFTAFLNYNNSRNTYFSRNSHNELIRYVFEGNTEIIVYSREDSGFLQIGLLQQGRCVGFLKEREMPYEAFAATLNHRAR